MIRRNIEDVLKRSLADTPVVLLNGARQTGKTIPYRNLPVAEYAAVLLQIGLPPVLAHGLASWDGDASRGALFDDRRELSRLIGRPTTPLAESVRQALKS